MAEPVLLISSDPFLGASLDAITRGRMRVARLDPARRPPAWPGEPGATVVLDVSARQRDAFYRWVRRHHPGPLVVLLKPGEREPTLPPDPMCLVLRRPFRLGDLVAVLEHAPGAGEETGVAGTQDEPEVAREEAPEQPEQAEAAEAQAAAVAGAATEGAGADPAPENLLIASAAQRRRRLGSLAAPASTGQASNVAGPAQATAAGTPGQATAARAAAPTHTPEAPTPGPSPAPRAPTPPPATPAPTVAAPTRAPRPVGVPVAERRGSWPPQPGRRGWRVAGRVLLGLVVLLAFVAAWLVLGLLEARRDLAALGGAVRDELRLAESALARGDTGRARMAVRAAGRNLDVAAEVVERRELRVAARLPLLSGAVADVRHLLTGGRHLVGGGQRAVAVADRLRPGGSAALRGGRFDLRALDGAGHHGRRLLLDLERARAELEQVRGGPLAPGAAETRGWALGRLAETSARVRAIVPTLEALPAALGAAGPRTYLLVLTDPPAPRPGRGGELAALEVVVDGGAVGLRPGGDELAERLEDAGAEADLPGAARALLGAGPARADGVVAVDPLGARTLLQATGPVDVPGWGRLDAAGASELGSGGRPARELLLGALLGRVLATPDLVATGQGLRAAAGDGNLRLLAADPGLQRVLTRHRLDGPTGRG